MSDSFPTDDEGPDPFLGQDLDSLLSGENCCVPEALRPVIPTLDALRAAPVRAELLGEAAARAYFREVMLAAESKPAGPNADSGEARTLIMPSGTPGDGPHPAPRRHRHRRPSPRGRWQAKALAVVGAAAVVIVGAAALAGTFSSSGGHPAATGRSHGAASPTGPGSHGVDGNGTPDSVNPTTQTSSSRQSGDGPSPRDLCREYRSLAADPGPHASPATEGEILRQLNSLADGQGGIAYYCLRLLQPWAALPGNFQGMPGYPYPGGLPSPHDSQGAQGDQGSHGSQGSQGAGSLPGDGGNGNNGSGNSGSSGNGNSGNGANGKDQGGNGSGSGAGTSGR